MKNLPKAGVHLTRGTTSLVAALAIAAASLALVAGSASSTSPCDRYASPSGDDGAPGTISQPFRTIDKLVNSVSSGETACLLGYPDGSPPDATGFYEEGPITIDVAGITLRSADGQVAQIKGALLVTADDVTVSRLVLDGRNPDDAASPKIMGSNVVLADNNVTTRSTADCVRVTGGAQQVSITHNRIHDCKAGTKVVNARNVLMTYNAVYDNSDAGVSLAPAADSAYVVRNIIDRNDRGIVWGSGVLPGDTEVSTSDGSVAAGNIVSNSVGPNVTADWHDPDDAGPADPVPGTANGFWTNCVYHPTLPGGGVDSGTTSHTWNPAKIWAPLNTVGDPLYADAERGDFTLAGASPCPRTTGDLSLAIADDGPGTADERPDESEAVNLRPNVLLIVTDDQRAEGTVVDDVMPSTLDWFKRGTPSGAPGGAEFAEAFATTPVCCPSRASIFTGQYVHNHGVNENTVVPPPSVDPDNPTYLIQPHTMQRYLRERAGYRTGLFGKFMNSWRFSGAVPVPNFDDYGYFQGEPHCPFQVMEDPGTSRTLGSAPTGDPLRCEVQTADDYSTTWVAQEGRRFIDEAEGSDDQPWYLYLAPAAPHDDNFTNSPVPEEQYVDAPVPSANALLNSPGFQEGLRVPGDQVADKPPSVRNSQPPCDPEQAPAECDAAWTDEVLRKRAEQLRTLMSVDDMVQGVFTKLVENGEDDDTLAFFISDNGWMWGEHGQSTKGRPYLESVKVPFFLRWPDNPVVDRGTTDSSRLVANIDIAPTVLDAVDVTPDHLLDGRSLIDPAMSRSRILTEFWRSGIWNWASLTTSSYQYTEYYSHADSGFLEYYRFPGDLAQTTNLFADDTPGDPPPSETNPIAADLQSSRTCAGAACP